MRYITLLALCLLCSASAFAQTESGIGLGYVAGSGGGLVLPISTNNWRFEPSVEVLYSTIDAVGSNAIIRTFTAGIGIFKICHLNDELSIVYGPRVLLSGNIVTSSSSFYTTQGTQFVSESNYRYFTTTALVEVGPEYQLGMHFSVGAAVAGIVMIQGRQSYEMTSGNILSPYNSSTISSLSLGGSVSGRYFF